MRSLKLLISALTKAQTKIKRLNNVLPQGMPTNDGGPSGDTGPSGASAISGMLPFNIDGHCLCNSCRSDLQNPERTFAKAGETLRNLIVHRIESVLDDGE